MARLCISVNETFNLLLEVSAGIDNVLTLFAESLIELILTREFIPIKTSNRVMHIKPPQILCLTVRFIMLPVVVIAIAALALRHVYLTLSAAIAKNLELLE